MNRQRREDIAAVYKKYTDTDEVRAKVKALDADKDSVFFSYYIDKPRSLADRLLPWRKSTEVRSHESVTDYYKGEKIDVTAIPVAIPRR